MGLAACSPLKTFNAIIPKDKAGRQAVEGAAYGAGARQKLDIFVPGNPPQLDTGASGTSGAALPVIIFFYGGSWNSGTRSGYDFVGRALAARGFVTMIPDYRLFPEVRYPAFVEDGAAAVRWARAHAAEHGGDPERIVLAGHSAGAYIAAMLALDGRWLGADRAAVKGLVGLAGPYDFVPFDGKITRDTFGEWPEPAETQPINWAGAGDPPTLLLSGARDDIVSTFNSEALALQLSQNGVDAQVKLYENVGHVGILTSIAKPLRGKSPALEDIATFAARVTSAE